MVTRYSVRGSFRSTTTRRSSDSVRKPLTRRWMRSISASSSWGTSGSGVQSLNSTMCFMESDDLQRHFVGGRREYPIEFSQILNGEVHVERRPVLLDVRDVARFGNGN